MKTEYKKRFSFFQQNKSVSEKLIAFRKPDAVLFIRKIEIYSESGFRTESFHAALALSAVTGTMVSNFTEYGAGKQIYTENRRKYLNDIRQNRRGTRRHFIQNP